MDPVDASNDTALGRLAAVLADIWPVPEGAQVTPLTAGANNLVLRVDDAGGSAHVLRVYRNHADSARVRHEVALLAALCERPLPFALPTALATRAGTPVHQVEVGGEGGLPAPALAVLWTYLPGSHPDPADATLAEAAGEALAILDTALATVDPASLPSRPTTPLGDLRRRLSMLEDPAAALRGLPLLAQDIEELLRQWRMVEELVPPLYVRLPHQLVHGDFDPSNVLFAGERVCGVLDFEFSGLDLRVADLAIALTWWPLHQFSTGAEWALMDALGRGYIAHLPLLPAELEVLPALFRLRAIGGLLHRVARHRQGREGAQQLVARAAFTLERERWLQRNEQRLLAMAQRWQQDS